MLSCCNRHCVAAEAVTKQNLKFRSLVKLYKGQQRGQLVRKPFDRYSPKPTVRQVATATAAVSTPSLAKKVVGPGPCCNQLV